MDETDETENQDDELARATAVIERLLADGALVLKKGRKPRRLAADLAPDLDRELGPDELADLLIDHRDVADLYADDEALATLLEGTRLVKATPKVRARFWQRARWSRWMADVVAARGPAERLERRRVGEVVIATGELVACDPLSYPSGARPFTRHIASGRYPLDLIVQVAEHSPAVTIACSVLELSATPPSSWELALPIAPGESLETLGPDAFFGFAVDAGIACYADASQRAAIEAARDQIRHAIYPIASTTGHVEVEIGPARLVIFQTGLGDGVYPSFFGLDDRGEPVCVVSDFMVLEPPPRDDD
jgi:hypothetical protein